MNAYIANDDPCENIRLEMAHTEEIFISHLEYLIKEYKEPLLQHARLMQVDETLLTLPEIDLVFGNVEMLLKLSKELLSKLHDKDVVCGCCYIMHPISQCLLIKNLSQTEKDVCRLFRRLDQQIAKIYIAFLNNSSKSTTTLVAAMEKRPAFAAFCRKRVRQKFVCLGTIFELPT